MTGLRFQDPFWLLLLVPLARLAAAWFQGFREVIVQADDGKQYRMLDVGSWSFDRINRELHRLACSGWKLIAVAGYGQCGVRLWLVK